MLWRKLTFEVPDSHLFFCVKTVEGHFNPGFFNTKLQPQTFQTRTFQPWTFQPTPWFKKSWLKSLGLLQCILSIFPACVHQFYVNLFVFVKINPFLYINDQFALVHSLRFLHILPQKENWLISGRRESPMTLLCTATIFLVVSMI